MKIVLSDREIVLDTLVGVGGRGDDIHVILTGKVATEELVNMMVLLILSISGEIECDASLLADTVRAGIVARKANENVNH